MASSAPRQLSRAARARRLGQRVGIAVFALFFTGATAAWTTEILTTVWGSAEPSRDGCAGGTAKLEQAVERARLAYLQGAGDETERAALARYRGALEPEWNDEKAVVAACRNDGAGRKRLEDVVALRYAEEHAVRYESLGLAPLRRRLKGRASDPDRL